MIRGLTDVELIKRIIHDALLWLFNLGIYVAYKIRMEVISKWFHESTVLNSSLNMKRFLSKGEIKRHSVLPIDVSNRESKMFHQ